MHLENLLNLTNGEITMSTKVSLRMIIETEDDLVEWLKKLCAIMSVISQQGMTIKWYTACFGEDHTINFGETIPLWLESSIMKVTPENQQKVMYALGEYLKIIGMSGTAFAQEIGISQSKFSRLNKGHIRLDNITLSKIIQDLTKRNPKPVDVLQLFYSVLNVEATEKHKNMKKENREC